MPRNGHLNRSHAEGQKGIFGLRQWNFQVFLILGLCKGRADSFQILCFSLRKFWRFLGRDSGNRAIRGSRFCAGKLP